MNYDVSYGLRELIQIIINTETDIPDIAIFPFGNNGIMLKQILNWQFGITEKYIIDNKLSKYNSNILSLNDFFKKDYENVAVLLNVTDSELNKSLEGELRNSGKKLKIYNVMSPNIIKAEEKEEYFRELKALLKVRKTDSAPFIRVGRNHDGGYIMLDDFNSGMSAYSIGICDDMSWDIDISEKAAIKVYMYDHTINNSPDQHSNCIFHKIGITAANNSKENLQTLSQMIEMNGDQTNTELILKIDIEGAEWEVLSSMDSDILKQFRQIAIEFHGMTDLTNMDNIITALKNLNNTHQVVWIHGNNYAPAEQAGDIIMPVSLEACYARKFTYDFYDGEARFPLAIDMPNFPIKYDFMLGDWGTHE